MSETHLTAYELAMLAAPFAAAGETDQAAMRRACSLLDWGEATARHRTMQAGLKSKHRAETLCLDDILGKMGLKDPRQFWKHFEAVHGTIAMLSFQEDKDPKEKCFPAELWKPVLAAQKEAVRLRNQKATAAKLGKTPVKRKRSLKS